MRPAELVRATTRRLRRRRGGREAPTWQERASCPAQPCSRTASRECEEKEAEKEPGARRTNDRGACAGEEAKKVSAVVDAEVAQYPSTTTAAKQAERRERQEKASSPSKVSMAPSRPTALDVLLRLVPPPLVLVPRSRLALLLVLVLALLRLDRSDEEPLDELGLAVPQGGADRGRELVESGDAADGGGARSARAGARDVDGE